MIYSFQGKTPKISKDVFIAPSADIIGDVTIAEHSSVWFHCTLRGDGFPIEVGEYTNIQDNTVVHITTNKTRTVIKNRVTIGHSVIIHAAFLDNFSFIGMGATLLDEVRVNPYGFVAAGALLPPNFEVPEKTLVAGVPAKIIRPLRDEEIKMIERSAIDYHQNSLDFQKNLKRIDTV